MTRRNLLSLVFLGVVTVSAAAGCGDAPGGGKTIKVVIAEYSKDHTRPFWQALAETYTKQTGVKVDLQVIDWNSIDQQVSTMIQNNQPPDILNLNAFASYAKDGLLYAADEVLSPKTREDFLEAFARGGEYQGKLYGFPILASARAFFYNQDLFTQAGLAEPAEDLGRVRRRPRRRSRRSAAGRSATRCRSAPRRPRPSGPSGCGTTAATGRPATRWTINSDKNVADAPVPRRPRQQAQGHPDQPGQDQPHRRRLPALQGRQGRHGHGLQPARRAARRRGQGATTAWPQMPTNVGTSVTLGVEDYLMAFKKKGNQEAVQAVPRPLLPAGADHALDHAPRASCP